MAYATPADVQNRLFGRELDEDELKVVETRLGDAELHLKSRIPDLDAKIDEGEIDEDLVVMIEAEMILRLVRNPEGYTQESDGNYSYSLSTQIASGKLDVLPSEWALLGLQGGVFTIRPFVQIPTAWCPPEFWS